MSAPAGKLLDRFTVAEGQGDEFDVGELTTYLNDALMLAPSMLLRPNTRWAEVDHDSFDVTLNDAGHGVTGRVFLDDRGAIRDFSTTDRFADLPSGLVRAEWRTPVPRWEVHDGRPIPGPFGATWHLPDGPLPLRGRALRAGEHRVQLVASAVSRRSGALAHDELRKLDA